MNATATGWKRALVGICALVSVVTVSDTASATSEIFYAKGGEAAATATAHLLDPELGPVSVQPWPGDWDCAVVVVVGDTVATP